MQSLQEKIDTYSAIAAEKAGLERQMKTLKSDILGAYNARPLEQEDRNMMRGTHAAIKIVVGSSNTFDRAKYELKHGSFHPAYFVKRDTVSLRLTQ